MLSLVLTFTSCSGDFRTVDDPWLGAEIEAYLPFVESVDLPDKVVEGETFSVSMSLSADINPGMLNGYQLSRYANVKSTYHHDSGTFEFEISTWTQGPFSNDNPDTTATIELGPLPAGTHKLIITTANTRQNGGIKFDWTIPDAFGPFQLDPKILPKGEEVASIIQELVVESK
jgi:hypothetical protein